MDLVGTACSCSPGSNGIGAYTMSAGTSSAGESHESTCWMLRLQVFRNIPGLAQQVAELSPPLSEWRRFIYCESMVSGQLLGEVDHFPGGLWLHTPTLQTFHIWFACCPGQSVHLFQTNGLPDLMQSSRVASGEADM